jgi:inosine/xanthosine triphosphate pyrophosphatase family protein
MSDRTRIFIATSNPAKADKLRWVLEGLPFAPLFPEELLGYRPPAETGGTFLENAMLKAVRGSEAVSGIAIASDGGVQVPALGQTWDSLYTGRAAGDDVEEEMRARHLLMLMQGKKGEERRIAWTEAVAVADAGRLLGSWQESGNEGVLTEEYDATHGIPGFWVYSLWYYPQLGKRYCDLTQQQLDSVDVTWRRIKERVQEHFLKSG